MQERKGILDQEPIEAIAGTLDDLVEGEGMSSEEFEEEMENWGYSPVRQEWFEVVHRGETIFQAMKVDLRSEDNSLPLANRLIVSSPELEPPLQVYRERDLGTIPISAFTELRRIAKLYIGVKDFVGNQNGEPIYQVLENGNNFERKTLGKDHSAISGQEDRHIGTKKMHGQLYNS